MQTFDKFLGGKVLLAQSPNGLRATSDSVLLAAAVLIKKGETLLDVGAGNGVVGLCVNARKKCTITALECQEKLVDIIFQNAQLNHTIIEIISHNLFNAKDIIKGRLFQHVVTNPPFYDHTGKGRQSAEQRLAYKAEFDLKKMVKLLFKTFEIRWYFYHDSSARNVRGDFICFINQKLGAIEIFPIQTKLNQPAKRVIIRGILGSKTPLKLYPPLVMHNPDGTRSETAENILRKSQAI